MRITNFFYKMIVLALFFQMIVISPVLASSDIPMTTNTISENAWTAFSKSSKPVLNPQWHVAGDASVIKYKGEYLMYYTCIDKEVDRLTICLAKSNDGNTWKRYQNNNKTEGRILKTNPSWGDALETSFALKVGEYIYLFFAGYNHKPGAFNYPSYFGVAASADGTSFYYPADHPVMAPTPNSFENDAIYSPSILQNGKDYFMVYSGFCFSTEECQKKDDKVTLLGATSTDGVLFSKNSEPVLQADPRLPWMQKGVAEAELVFGPDQYFYLFFTAIDAQDKNCVGLARSKNPFGPWEINPQPILKPSTEDDAFDHQQLVAPSVLIENGVVRVWYSGFSESGYIKVGYAQANWPLVK